VPHEDGKERMNYKAILEPVWTYGVEVWGCSKPSNTKSKLINQKLSG
jgi:hypothetical protein